MRFFTAPSAQDTTARSPARRTSIPIAPTDRYGPNGIRSDRAFGPNSITLTPTTDPTIDAAAIVKNTAFHPRKAPIPAINFTSPRPIASRGKTNSFSRPENVSIFSVS